MADLNPTPARLALLRQIADPDATGVYVSRSVVSWQIESRIDRPGDLALRVTSKCAEMAAAGWIEQGPAESRSMYARRRWQVTPAGQAVLDAHPKEK